MDVPPFNNVGDNVMSILSTIEIDCQPGYPRPNDLLPGVLDGTGVKIDPENTIGRFFGNWTWEIPEDQEKTYRASVDTIKERLTALYHAGTVRYASW